MSVFGHNIFSRKEPSKAQSMKAKGDGFAFDNQISESTLATSGLLTTRPSNQLGWRHWALPTLSLILIVALGPLALALLHAQYIFPTVNDQVSQLEKACDVDRLWSSWSTLFQVNIRSGYVSFTTAKVIDVAWDATIGRGGQFLLMWIAYRVNTDVMVWLAEHEAIDFNLFTSTMLYGDSLWTVSTATKSLFSNMSKRTKWMLGWMVLSISYILFFPTMLSASTSYVAATRPAALLVDNTTIPLKTYLESATYSLTNHGIDNQPSPWYVSVGNISTIPDQMDSCNMIWRSGHRYTGGHNFTVDGTGYPLSNSTTVRCGFYYNQHFYDKSNVSGPGNATYLSLPNDQAVCEPDGKNYQWGASFELLMILIILQCVWSIGMWIVWTISNRGSELVRHGRKMGRLRAVLDIAKPMTESNIDDAMVLGNSDLQQIVRRRGPVKYCLDYDTNGKSLKVDVVEIDEISK